MLNSLEAVNTVLLLFSSQHSHLSQKVGRGPRGGGVDAEMHEEVLLSSWRRVSEANEDIIISMCVSLCWETNHSNHLPFLGNCLFGVLTHPDIMMPRTVVYKKGQTVQCLGCKNTPAHNVTRVVPSVINKSGVPTSFLSDH